MTSLLRILGGWAVLGVFLFRYLIQIVRFWQGKFLVFLFLAADFAKIIYHIGVNLFERFVTLL